MTRLLITRFVEFHPFQIISSEKWRPTFEPPCNATQRRYTLVLLLLTRRSAQHSARFSPIAYTLFLPTYPPTYTAAIFLAGVRLFVQPSSRPLTLLRI